MGLTRGTALYNFLVSLQMTQPEATMVWLAIQKLPETRDLDIITHDQIRKILEFVRERVPVEYRWGAPFGGN